MRGHRERGERSEELGGSQGRLAPLGPPGVQDVHVARSGSGCDRRGSGSGWHSRCLHRLVFLSGEVLPGSGAPPPISGALLPARSRSAPQPASARRPARSVSEPWVPASPRLDLPKAAPALPRDKHAHYGHWAAVPVGQDWPKAPSSRLDLVTCFSREHVHRGPGGPSGSGVGGLRSLGKRRGRRGRRLLLQREGPLQKSARGPKARGDAGDLASEERGQPGRSGRRQRRAPGGLTSSSGSLTSTHRFLFSSQTIWHGGHKGEGRSAGGRSKSKPAHLGHGLGCGPGRGAARRQAGRHATLGTHRLVFVVGQVRLRPLLHRQPAGEPGLAALHVKPGERP